MHILRLFPLLLAALFFSACGQTDYSKLDQSQAADAVENIDKLLTRYERAKSRNADLKPADSADIVRATEMSEKLWQAVARKRDSGIETSTIEAIAVRYLLLRLYGAPTAATREVKPWEAKAQAVNSIIASPHFFDFKDPRLFYLLAQAEYLRQRDDPNHSPNYETAMRYLARALQAKKDFPEAQWLRARILSASKQPVEAAQARRAAHLAIDHLDPLLFLYDQAAIEQMRKEVR